MKKFRNPQGIHQPLGGYVHQVEITGKERLLIISGQVGMRKDGTIPEDPLEQMDIALENIFQNLRAADMEVTDIVKLTYYLVGEIDTSKRRALAAAKLHGHQPCSTLIYVAGLASPAYRVEVEAWATHAE